MAARPYGRRRKRSPSTIADVTRSSSAPRKPPAFPPTSSDSAEAHWLGTRFERPAEVEGPRVRLTSVPYALKAADAETLGGRPASDYVISATGATDASTSSTANRDVAAPSDVLPGTTNYLAKYVNSADVGPSSLFDAGGAVGLGTTAPLDALHVKFTDIFGGATGIAVQNLGNTATSYFGMLFYDQNGALGQFQGFNNFTHEYRINNIARNFGQYNGSINFMTGNVSRFFVGSNGTVGIGTTSPIPGGSLELSNALTGAPTTDFYATTYGNAAGAGSNFHGRSAAGTAAAPLPISGTLLNLRASGYDGNSFVNTATISMQTTEPWSTTAHGTRITFTTGHGIPMTIGPTDSVGIVTTSPIGNLEVSNTSYEINPPSTLVTVTSVGNNAAVPTFQGRHARGGGLNRSGVLNGDTLAAFQGMGYSTTDYGTGGAAMVLQASQNWTDIAQGTAIQFMTTSNGTATPAPRMTLAQSGNVGIGTTNPAAALDVFRTDTDAAVITTGFTSVSQAVPVYLTRASRGTPSVSSPLLTGDLLGHVRRRWPRNDGVQRDADGYDGDSRGELL